MKEVYSLEEIKEKLEHEKYLRKENQELYEELQVLRKCSNGTNDLANEYKKRIDKAIEYIENNFISYEDSRTFGGLGEEIDIQVKEIRELLNILKGVDKE